MRNRNALLVALATLAIGLLPGCATLKAAAAGIQRPSVAFDSAHLDAIDLDGFTLGLKWNVDNPNDIPFRLTRLGWQLQLDGRDAARGDSTSPIDVPAKAVSPVTVPVRIRWTDLPGLLQLAMRREDLPFKVSGTAAVGSMFGSIDVPFSREGTLAFPRNVGLGALGG